MATKKKSAKKTSAKKKSAKKTTVSARYSKKTPKKKKAKQAAVSVVEPEVSKGAFRESLDAEEKRLIDSAGEIHRQIRVTAVNSIDTLARVTNDETKRLSRYSEVVSALVESVVETINEYLRDGYLTIAEKVALTETLSDLMAKSNKSVTDYVTLIEKVNSIGDTINDLKNSRDKPLDKDVLKGMRGDADAQKIVYDIYREAESAS